MDEWIKVVILGIVEGITEFLPISSTGHLLVFSSLLDFKKSLNGTFEIFIQIGAVVAVIGFYRHDIWRQVRTVRSDQGVQKLWLAIIIASIPAAVMGLLLHDIIKEKLFPQDHSSYVVAITLILGGIVFLIVEQRRFGARTITTSELSEVTIKQSLVIGVCQMLALVPGVSRSGASIIGGMLVGLNRQTATAFSFYLSIPVLGGATIVDLLLSADEITRDDLAFLLIGAVISGIVAWIAIGWLLRYVERNDFIYFGYYRIIAGAIIIFLIVIGTL
jgi:undecaprenyl-diphosphatase